MSPSQQTQATIGHQLAHVSPAQAPVSQYPLAVPMPQVAAPQGPEKGTTRSIISVEDIIRYLKRYWKISAIVSGITSLLLCLLLIGRTPLFESETLLQVKIGGISLAPGQAAAPLENSATFIVNNHNIRLNSRKYQEFFYAKVESEDKKDFLEDRGFSKPIVAKGIGWVKDGILWVKNSVASLFGGDDEDSGDPAIAERDAFLKKLGLSVKVDLMKESHVLRISFKTPNRRLAAAFANQYALMYPDYLAEEQRGAARDAFEFLSDQELRYRELSQASTQALNQFRLKNEILDDGQDADPMKEQLKLIYSARANERIALTQSESVLLQVARLCESQQDLLNIREIDRSPNVVESKTAFSLRQQEYAAQSSLHGESHTAVREAKGRADAAYGLLQDEIERAVQAFANQKAAAKEKLAAFDDQLRQVEVEVVQQGEKGIELANLVAREQSDQKTYQEILAKLNESRIQMEIFITPDVEVVDKAVEAEKPFRPNKPLSVIMSSFVFAFLFVGIPVAFGLGNDITRRFGIRIPFFHRNLPVELGRVPLVAGSSTMNMLADAFSPGATREALFKLARNVDQKSRAASGGAGRVILVTSAVENEGKSFVTAALAGAYCSQGRRTLIIDCNLRSPSMNIWFPNLNGRANLADWLESGGEQPIDLDSLRHGSSDLFVLPAHGWAMEPESLLKKPCLGQLIEYAKDNYDFVFLDGPQIKGHTDGELLAKHAGEIILVSDRKLSDYKQLGDACTKLGDGAQKRIAGLIGNRSDQSA
ncbi:MAG: succinoglycan biosynthesis transport protein ExoP [Verrucomicrobiales bacterium]|jgi:succinoglycan biosynthesis transport protein ExoP